MNTLTTPAQSALIDGFIELYKQGSQAWMRAGEIIVELVEDDPHVFDYIIEKCPLLNAGILGRFEQMGRKILHPHLLLTSSPGFKKLSRLPYSMQERFISEPIPLIIHSVSGTDVLLVKAKDLTPKQARQVFAPGRLRTESEQKAWLMENGEEKMVKQLPRFRGNKISLNGEFTRRELLSILAQML